MEVFTKKEAIEISLRPQMGAIDESIINRTIEKMLSYDDHDLLRILRESTKLNFCIFTAGKYTIKYN